MLCECCQLLHVAEVWMDGAWTPIETGLCRPCILAVNCRTHPDHP